VKLAALLKPDLAVARPRGGWHPIGFSGERSEQLPVFSTAPVFPPGERIHPKWWKPVHGRIASQFLYLLLVQ
jgi:hypothetical protein